MIHCEICEKWRKEYNAAVANGLIMKARQIGRRIDAHNAAVAQSGRAIG